jgi:protein-tyrosine phosphatase
MQQILFVCMGNICRSPLAEAAFAQHIAQRGLSGRLTVRSAGTVPNHQGERPDPRAVRVAMVAGYTRIEQIRARHLDGAMLADSDLVLVMDEQNLRETMRRTPPAHQHKVHLLLPYAGVTTRAEVPDPYYGNVQGFENVLALCEASVEGVLARLMPQR